MKQRRRKAKGNSLFWRDVCISGGQVTFGVVAALWFIPPLDTVKIGVLVFNGFVTTVLIVIGWKISKNP